MVVACGAGFGSYLCYTLWKELEIAEAIKQINSNPVSYKSLSTDLKNSKQIQNVWGNIIKKTIKDVETNRESYNSLCPDLKDDEQVKRAWAIQKEGAGILEPEIPAGILVPKGVKSQPKVIDQKLSETIEEIYSEIKSLPNEKLTFPVPWKLVSNANDQDTLEGSAHPLRDAILPLKAQAYENLAEMGKINQGQIAFALRGRHKLTGNRYPYQLSIKVFCVRDKSDLELLFQLKRYPVISDQKESDEYAQYYVDNAAMDHARDSYLELVCQKGWITSVKDARKFFEEAEAPGSSGRKLVFNNKGFLPKEENGIAKGFIIVEQLLDHNCFYHSLASESRRLNKIYIDTDGWKKLPERQADWRKEIVTKARKLLSDRANIFSNLQTTVFVIDNGMKFDIIDNYYIYPEWIDIIEKAGLEIKKHSGSGKIKCGEYTEEECEKIINSYIDNYMRASKSWNGQLEFEIGCLILGEQEPSIGVRFFQTDKDPIMKNGIEYWENGSWKGFNESLEYEKGIFLHYRKEWHWNTLNLKNP